MVSPGYGQVCGGEAKKGIRHLSWDETLPRHVMDTKRVQEYFPLPRKRGALRLKAFLERHR